VSSALVVAAASATCATTSLKALWCWGDAATAQLGAAPTADPVRVEVVSTQGAVSVAVGGSHSCAIAATGTAHCWGSNAQGQLCASDTEDRFSNGPAPAVDLSEIVVGVALGEVHSCFHAASGLVYCVGSNSVGQIGLGPEVAQVVANATLPAVLLGNHRVAKQLAAGAWHNCVVFEDSDLKCWGDNSHAQIGTGGLDPVMQSERERGEGLESVLTGVASVACASNRTCAVLLNGDLLCWGQGWPQASARESPVVLQGVQQVALGGEHVCAFMVDGRVFCWGSGANGRLGAGSTRDATVADAVEVVAVRDVQVVSIVAGDCHTCVVGALGYLGCWGCNEHAALGTRDRADRGDSAGRTGFRRFMIMKGEDTTTTTSLAPTTTESTTDAQETSTTTAADVVDTTSTAEGVTSGGYWGASCVGLLGLMLLRAQSWVF